MQESEVYSKLTDVFHSVFQDESIVLRPEITTEDVDGWDSFNHIRLIVATEECFKIKFKIAELELLANVGHFVNIIASKVE